MNRRVLMGFVLVLALPCGAFAMDEPPVLQMVSRIVPPRLEKNQPDVRHYYPVSSRREALVFLRFNLTAKGEITDLELDEGGFHTKLYVDAAMQVARRLRFSPATQDGKPVEYTGARIPIRFSLPGDDGGRIQGITEQFRAETKKVQALIETNDLAGAQFHAQWMMAEKVKLEFEYAVLQSTLAYTHARAGNIHSALAASREVTSHAGMDSQDYQPGGPLPKLKMGDFLLTKDLLGPMLELRFNLAASQGFFLDALRAHADMQALGMVKEGDPSMAKFQKMLTAVQVAPALLAHARIDEAKNWDHELLFHNFAANSVRDGSLSDVTLVCAGYYRKLIYIPDVEWNVPPRWENCRVHFTGTPGTRFDIVEYRNTPQTSSAAASTSAGAVQDNAGK